MAAPAVTYSIEYPHQDGSASHWFETILTTNRPYNVITQIEAESLGYQMPHQPENLPFLGPDHMGEIEMTIKIEGNRYIVPFQVLEAAPWVCYAALGTQFFYQTGLVIHLVRRTFAVRGGVEQPLVGYNPITSYPVLTWDELELLHRYENMPLHQLEILSDHEDSHAHPELGWEAPAEDPIQPAPEEWEINHGPAIAAPGYLPED